MMSDPDEDNRRMVILKVDAESYSFSTVELAVAMAASLQVQLHGFFIESEDLLRVAALPFCREIGIPSARERVTDSLMMQRSLKAMAEQFRKNMARSAKASQVQWSYDYVRGHVRDINHEAELHGVYTIVGNAVFRRPESGHSRRCRRVLLVEDHATYLVNALQVIVDKFQGQAVEITIIKNTDNSTKTAALLLRKALKLLPQVKLVELEQSQLSAVLAAGRKAFDYVIVSSNQPRNSLKEILNKSLCPVIITT